ncbi:unnamed protein product [Rotaria socialis]
MYGLARRLQIKTIGLHEDNELQRSDDSSVDSDASKRHHRSLDSVGEYSKDKDIGKKSVYQLDILSKPRIRAMLLAQPMTSSNSTNDSAYEDVVMLYLHLKSSFNLTNTNATTTNDNKSKFRRVQMYPVMENSSSSAPTIIGINEDVNNYYERPPEKVSLGDLLRQKSMNVVHRQHEYQGILHVNC